MGGHGYDECDIVCLHVACVTLVVHACIGVFVSMLDLAFKRSGPPHLLLPPLSPAPPPASHLGSGS